MSLRTTLLTAAVIVLAQAAPALAADHIMRIDEIFLANSSGSATSQFVELEDPGESFPNPPYTLQLFDAAGASIGSQTLTLAAGTMRYLVATTQAATDLGVTPQATLTLSLPASGQICFKRGASALIHCHSWGTITTPVVALNQTTSSVAPPNGMSIQRVNSAYFVAAPTPGAVNTNGMVDMPVIDGPALDAGVDDAGPDAPGGHPNNSSDDGCSVGAGASWFGLAMLSMLLIAGRVTSRRRRR